MWLSSSVPKHDNLCFAAWIYKKKYCKLKQSEFYMSHLTKYKFFLLTNLINKLFSKIKKKKNNEI